MTTSTKGLKGVKPEWAFLPKRNCDNCGTRYKPKQPLRVNQKHGFCKPDCKKQFHKHGAAFMKLKDVVLKEIARLRLTLEERCKLCKGTSLVNSGKQRGKPCTRCLGGKVLTPFGHEVMALVVARLVVHIYPGEDGARAAIHFRDGVNP